MTALPTPDQIATSQKLIKDCNLALATLLPLITKDNLDTEYAKTILELVEMNMAEISKQIGVPTEIQAEIEKRFADIRAANIRIGELERQIGESAQIDLTIQSVKLLEEKFHYWWRTKGFGHASKFSIGGYGAKSTLSGHLYGNYSSQFSETPVSDKENTARWFKYLVEQGFIVTDDDPQQNKSELVDCDKNRNLITELITKQLPSAHIISLTNFRKRSGVFVVRDIKIIVRDLRDIDALPPPATQ